MNNSPCQGNETAAALDHPRTSTMATIPSTSVSKTPSDRPGDSMSEESLSSVTRRVTVLFSQEVSPDISSSIATPESFVSSRFKTGSGKVPVNVTTESKGGQNAVVTPAQTELSRPTKSNPVGEDTNSQNASNLQVLVSLTMADGSIVRVVTGSAKPITERLAGLPDSALELKTPFAVITHKMVHEVHAEDPSIMRWEHNGDAFWVDPDHLDLPQVLSLYFQHSKYTSFQRQLNTYGWTKCRSGRYVGCFYRPHFHRDTSNMNFFASIQRGSHPSSKLLSTRAARPIRQVQTLLIEVLPTPSPSCPFKKRKVPLGKGPSPTSVETAAVVIKQSTRRKRKSKVVQAMTTKKPQPQSTGQSGMFGNSIQDLLMMKSHYLVPAVCAPSDGTSQLSSLPYHENVQRKPTPAVMKKKKKKAPAPMPGPRVEEEVVHVQAPYHSSAPRTSGVPFGYASSYGAYDPRAVAWCGPQARQFWQGDPSHRISMTPSPMLQKLSNASNGEAALEGHLRAARSTDIDFVCNQDLSSYLYNVVGPKKSQPPPIPCLLSSPPAKLPSRRYVESGLTPILNLIDRGFDLLSIPTSSYCSPCQRLEQVQYPPEGPSGVQLSYSQGHPTEFSPVRPTTMEQIFTPLSQSATPNASNISHPQEPLGASQLLYRGTANRDWKTSAQYTPLAHPWTEEGSKY